MKSKLGSVAVAVVAILALTAFSTPPNIDASNANPSDPNNRWGWFEAGLEWFGDFGDPHIVRVGNTYYAYSSPTGGRYVPVLTSTDLKHWYIHQRYTDAPPPWLGGNPNTDPKIPIEIRQSTMSPGDKWNMNDALVKPASWGLTHDQGPWIKKDLWAPGVIKMGTTWFAYSAVRVSWEGDDPNRLGRFCITVASSSSPLGPFRDISGSAPILCNSDPSGSIDPYPYYDKGTETYYLLWKAAGKRSTPGNPGYPSRLQARELDTNGFLDPIAPTRTLLSTNEGGWEGQTIENPSMINFKGTKYLFYSGNSSFADSSGRSPYATGYAICPKGPRGACTRMTTASPLLASGDPKQGPGGASAFIDTAGRLRLGYSYFWLGENRTNTAIEHPRRLAIATLHKNNTTKRLSIVPNP